MISIDFGTAIFLYTTSSIALVLFLWIFFERPDSFGRFITAEEAIWQCVICTFTYVDSRHETISQCPQCKSYNKREDS